jgi:hypothetical protein
MTNELPDMNLYADHEAYNETPAKGFRQMSIYPGERLDPFEEYRHEHNKMDLDEQRIARETIFNLYHTKVITKEVYEALCKEIY